MISCNRLLTVTVLGRLTALTGRDASPVDTSPFRHRRAGPSVRCGRIIGQVGSGRAGGRVGRSCWRRCSVRSGRSDGRDRTRLRSLREPGPSRSRSQYRTPIILTPHMTSHAHPTPTLSRITLPLATEQTSLLLATEDDFEDAPTCTEEFESETVWQEPSLENLSVAASTTNPRLRISHERESSSVSSNSENEESSSNCLDHLTICPDHHSFRRGSSHSICRPN